MSCQPPLPMAAIKNASVQATARSCTRAAERRAIHETIRHKSNHVACNTSFAESSQKAKHCALPPRCAQRCKICDEHQSNPTPRSIIQTESPTDHGGGCRAHSCTSRSSCPAHRALRFLERHHRCAAETLATALVAAPIAMQMGGGIVAVGGYR